MFIIPVHAIVITLGFSSVPQDTITDGTGEINAPPFHLTFFKIILLYISILSLVNESIISFLKYIEKTTKQTYKYVVMWFNGWGGRI